MEEACRRPEITYPFRVPMKIIGRQEELRPEMATCKGSFISYTFWVTLPDDQAESPLREAIQKLPGVVMQL